MSEAYFCIFVYVGIVDQITIIIFFFLPDEIFRRNNYPFFSCSKNFLCLNVSSSFIFKILSFYNFLYSFIPKVPHMGSTFHFYLFHDQFSWEAFLKDHIFISIHFQSSNRVNFTFFHISILKIAIILVFTALKRTFLWELR